MAAVAVMKAVFVDQIKDGMARFTSVFVVAHADRRKSKMDKPYLSLTLADKTGNVAAVLWDVPEGLEASTGAFVKVEADASTYNDKPQLTLTRIRTLTEEERPAAEDYLPASKCDRESLFADALTLTDRIENPALHVAVSDMLEGNKAALLDCPAAKSNHQPYLGGLLEHIVGIGRTVIAVCDVYPQLDRDILIASAMIHDIGKIQELQYQTSIGYSRIGSLVGHVILGSVLFEKYSGSLDQATRTHLLHIIASHHGRLEWSAAVVPMTKEAMVFHSLDMLDARINMAEITLAEGVDSDGFSGFHRSMETKFWNGKA